MTASATTAPAALGNDRDCLLSMIAAAVRAPSADNNQPWRFALVADRLHIYRDRRRALPSDVGNMFDLLAVGAAIENARLSAHRAGRDVAIVFPRTPCVAAPDAGSDADGELIASIELRGDQVPDDLAEFIRDRRTRRCAFAREPIPAEELASLAGQTVEFPRVRLDWLVAPDEVRAVGRLVAATDAIRFERRAFHAELYKQLRFSPAEAERTGDGLDLRALELPLGGGAVLRALRSWTLTRCLNFCGLSRLLAAPSARLVRRSGAVGVLTVDRADRDAFVQVGRAFQRVWLATESKRLALHPLGSLPIFLAHRRWPRSPLSNSQRARVDRVADRLFDLLPALAGRTVAMLFRVGRTPQTQWRSCRRPVHDVLVVQDSGDGDSRAVVAEWLQASCPRELLP